MAQFKIKKGDQVVVTTGRDRGKKGEVLEVLRSDARVRVQGVNVVKRHTRPSQTNAGGIEAFEAPIAISNVAHIDPESGAATRVSMVTTDGKKQRVAKASGKVIG